MIIGGNRNEVIRNIQRAVAEGNFNRKVEPGDPVLSEEEKLAVSCRCLNSRNNISYRFCNRFARMIEDAAGMFVNADTQIVGMENLDTVTGGAVLTSNHFNPLDNTILHYLAKKAGHNRLYTVSQDTNFAAPGLTGFLLYYSDTIPITGAPGYMEKAFFPLLQELFCKKQWVVIYPEQEMWFNYRKPRPLKRGAYYYAARCHVPVISCFVEIRDLERKDTAGFRKVRYILHVLPVIWPEAGKSVRENSTRMMEKDYEQKKKAYEAAYQKELTYRFSGEDIAGWMPAGEIHFRQ